LKQNLKQVGERQGVEVKFYRKVFSFIRLFDKSFPAFTSE